MILNAQIRISPLKNFCFKVKIEREYTIKLKLNFIIIFLI
jgi:hypothetical protein